MVDGARTNLYHDKVFLVSVIAICTASSSEEGINSSNNACLFRELILVVSLRRYLNNNDVNMIKVMKHRNKKV